MLPISEPKPLESVAKGSEKEKEVGQDIQFVMSCATVASEFVADLAKRLDYESEQIKRGESQASVLQEFSARLTLMLYNVKSGLVADTAKKPDLDSPKDSRP